MMITCHLHGQWGDCWAGGPPSSPDTGGGQEDHYYLSSVTEVKCHRGKVSKCHRGKSVTVLCKLKPQINCGLYQQQSFI